MLVYAHRGYKKKENTIEAFTNSFSKFDGLEFDGIEFDVRLSKDKIPVVIHDSNLLRTHNVNIVVHLTNYIDLKKYNLLTLSETLTLVKENKKKCLIDIKVKSNSNFIIAYLKDLVNRKIISSSMFKCIVYTDNVIFDKNIKLLRAYKYIIPKNINTDFHGIALKYDNTIENKKSIITSLDNLRSNNLHLNLYFEKYESNTLGNFLKLLLNAYNNVSLSFD